MMKSMISAAILRRQPGRILIGITTFGSTTRRIGNTIRCCSSSLLAGPITSAYQRQVEVGTIRHDEDQRQLASRLDHLYQELQATDAKVPPASNLYVAPTKNGPILERIQDRFRRLFRPTPPRGLYIHGNVGVGKSMLMDTFYHAASSPSSSSAAITKDDANNTKNSDAMMTITQNRKCRRVHFHEFMLRVHELIHAFKQRHPRGDALPAVALHLAQEARLLCFDEFQVTDIADAMILKRLFDMLLLDFGVVVVATSNRAPSELYQGGINRSRFLPFIDTLHQYLDVVAMTGGHDYRRDEENTTGIATTSTPAADAPSFYWPSSDIKVRQALEDILDASLGQEEEGETQDKKIPVRMGRTVRIPRATNTAAWFDFAELCGKPLGAADYLAICEHFQIVMVDHVPQLDSRVFNEARRFVALIDALYETKTRLVLASDVPLNDLFVNFEVVVETKDGDEESTSASSTLEEEEDSSTTMYVKGEGGSSSSASTTMIRSKGGEDVEWSATGRIGVSLAQLSAVQDVTFSFRRAESRLAEMNRPSWGR